LEEIKSILLLNKNLIS